MVLLVLVAFVAGLVTAVSPCVLPVLPIVLATGADGDRRRPYLVIAGLIASFSFFTLASVQVIAALHLPSSLLRDIAIVFIAIFGLTLLVPAVSEAFERATGRLQAAGGRLVGRSTPGSLSSAGSVASPGSFGSLGSLAPASAGGASIAARQPGSDESRRGSVAGGLLTGVGLGLVWTPCAGPILGAITSLAVTAPSSGATALLVLAYAIGAALPLLAIAQGGRALLARLRVRAASAWVPRAFGALVIATAGLMAVGADTAISANLTSSLPDWTGTLQTLERSNPVRDALSQLEGSGRQQIAGATANPAAGNPNGPGGTTDPAAGLSDLGAAPEFAGIDHWLNTKPLTLAELRGKVVLVDFWTYSCINCIRTLPFVESWYQRYASAGFVVVGVHSPEFAFEHDTGNVAAAIARFGITYPVAQDNEFHTWSAYANEYWPADYLIDAKGHIREVHFGEGDYDRTEADIRALLEETGKSATASPAATPGSVPIAGGQTPETYLGTDRESDFSGGPLGDGRHSLTFPARLDPDIWALSGDWDFGGQYITAAKAGDGLEFNFQASDVYLVMSAPASVTAHVKVTDSTGQAVGVIANEDIGPDGNLTVSSARLYHLVALPQSRRATVTITFDQPGVQAYAFTFGSR